MKHLWALALITVIVLSSNLSSSVLLARTDKYLPNSVSAIQEFGIQESHVLWESHSLANITTMLDRVRSGGLTRLRINLEWQLAEPTRGVWDETYLSKLDSVLDLMHERGIEPLVIFLTAPPWARTTGTGCWPEPRDWAIPPDNSADYADAIGYLAQRYIGRIHAWEIWNEPNICDFWNTPTGPDSARYTEMLKAAYVALKAVDPGIVVLAGSLSGNDVAYLQGMYAAGAGGYFDALSLHPYTPHDPDWLVPGEERWSFAAVPQMEQAMADLGEPGKPIWITEMGWSTDLGVSDSTRAAYFRRAVEMVQSWPYVKVFIAYYLDADGDPPHGYELWVGNPSVPTETWNAYTTAIPRSPFTDLPITDPFYPYVRCLLDRGIISGYDDGTFRPGAEATRGQVAKMIANAAGITDPIPPGQQTFNDVPPSHTFWLFIERLATRNSISGYDDGTFRPANNVTRGQLAKIDANAAGFNEPVSGQTFSDIPPSHTFYLFIERLVARGVLGGYTDGTFRPGNAATRAQTSKIIANSFFPNCQVP